MSPPLHPLDYPRINVNRHHQTLQHLSYKEASCRFVEGIQEACTSKQSFNSFRQKSSTSQTMSADEPYCQELHKLFEVINPHGFSHHSLGDAWLPPSCVLHRT